MTISSVFLMFRGTITKIKLTCRLKNIYGMWETSLLLCSFTLFPLSDEQKQANRSADLIATKIRKCSWYIEHKSVHYCIHMYIFYNVYINTCKHHVTCVYTCGSFNSSCIVNSKTKYSIFIDTYLPTHRNMHIVHNIPFQ